jgi:hypothetical protein
LSGSPVTQQLVAGAFAAAVGAVVLLEHHRTPESGAKDPRVATLAKVLAAAGSELEVRPRRTRNELFVDLMCERLAGIVLDDPSVLDRGREVLQSIDSAWVDVWRSLLNLGPVPVAAILTSPHPAARPLKADTPFAVLGLIDLAERREILDRAWELHRAA